MLPKKARNVNASYLQLLADTSIICAALVLVEEHTVKHNRGTYQAGAAERKLQGSSLNALVGATAADV